PGDRRDVADLAARGAVPAPRVAARLAPALGRLPHLPAQRARPAAPTHLRLLHAGQRVLRLRADGVRLRLVLRGPGDAGLHLERVLDQLRDQLDGHDGDVAALGAADPHHPPAPADPGGADRGVPGELRAADLRQFLGTPAW